MTADRLAGIPAHLLPQMVRVWIDEDGLRDRVITAEEFFRENADDNADHFPAIIEALLAGGTYRDGGGAGVEWTVRLVECVRWVVGEGWVRDHDAVCRADIAHGLHTVLTDAKAAFADATPGDVDGIVDTVRRQVASCMPEATHAVDARTKLLIDNIDHADLKNEAERIASWVQPGVLHDAARFAVRPLRGRI